MRKDFFVVFLIVMALIFINATSVMQLMCPTYTKFYTTQFTVSSQTVTSFTYQTTTMSARAYHTIGPAVWVSSASTVSATTGFPFLSGYDVELQGPNDRPQGTIYLKLPPSSTGSGTFCVLERRK